MLKTANLALSFILELVAVLAFAFWGFTTQNGLAGKLLWGLGAPAVVIMIWWSFIAPKARMRLADPLRLLNQIIIFGLAALALYAAGLETLGLIFFALFFLNMVLSFLWGQRNNPSL